MEEACSCRPEKFDYLVLHFRRFSEVRRIEDEERKAKRGEKERRRREFEERAAAMAVAAMQRMATRAAAFVTKNAKVGPVRRSEGGSGAGGGPTTPVRIT